MSTIKGISEAVIAAKLDEEVQNLKTKLLEKDRQIKAYKKDHGSIATIARAITDTVSAMTAPKITYRDLRKTQKVTSDCELVVHWTDWHYGAVQESDEIEGINRFSPEICEARIFNFVNDVLDWLEVHRHGYTIAKLRIILTGDLVSGDIHDELRITNKYPTPVQAVNVSTLLGSAISMFSPHFKSVEIEFICADNHSRLVKKPQSKEEGMNNYGYIIAHFAKTLLLEHKNVKFNIYPMYEKVINISNMRCLLLHGHGIKGWAGFPYYGIERKAAREATYRMNMPDPLKFHKIIMGHFHAPLDHPVYSIGGSVSGTDAFDHKNGRYAKPSQTVFLVHPKNGMFDRTNFLLKE